MKRPHVVHIITKLELGGAQKSTLATVNCLSQDGYAVSLITSPDGPMVDDVKKIPGIAVHFVPTLKREISPLDDLRAARRLYRLIKKIDAKIVHTHSSKAGILGRWAAHLAKVPVIVHTIHGFSFHRQQWAIVRWFYILLERLTARITDKLIAVCEADIKKGLRAGIGFESKYTLVRETLDGVDVPEVLSAEEKKKELGIDPCSPLVGLVACLKPQKAPLDFIRACKIVADELPEVKFLLVGDGGLRQKVEKLVAKLGLGARVLLAGWRRDALQVINTLDILVLSSLWEGLPLVLREAMVCGKPIVATDAGGTREVITDGVNGYLVAPGDYKSLAQGILDLLKDRAHAKEMGEKGRELVSRLSLDTNSMADKIKRIYIEAKPRYR